MKWTHVGVVAFIVLLLLAAVSANNARAEDGARIALGYSLINSEVPVGEVGYEYRGWEVAASLFGEGSTKRGRQDLVPVYSLSYLTRPDWWFLGGRNYYRIGVAYVDGSPIVGHANFRLGVGMEWSVVQVEYFHYSSAGINEINSGIDGIQVRYLIH